MTGGGTDEPWEEQLADNVEKYGRSSKNKLYCEIAALLCVPLAALVFLLLTLIK